MFKKLKSVRESTINVPFVLIVLVAGGIAYTNPERITIDLFCILLISIFLDTLHFFWMSNKVEIVIEPNESKIQKEEELEVLIKVENRSFWPTTYLYIYPEEGYRLVLKEKRAYCIFLGGQSIKKFKVTYEAVLSGKQKVGLTRAFAKDYLGLYKKEILVPEIGRASCRERVYVLV